MNVLFITVDELRYPPEYTSPELREWMRKNLVAQTFLEKNGINFRQHRVGATACAPSRTTLHTGQYPSLHGVSQTDDLAKTANDADMFWLQMKTVPTWGNYLRKAGYRTYYRGKWHISNADIYFPGTINPLTSFDEETGIPNFEKILEYKKANKLEPYGFNGWVGPEPQGSNPHNSGGSAAVGMSGRDSFYAEEVSCLIKNLDSVACSDGKRQPWAIVASFVNPHDIVLYGDDTKTNSLFNFEIDSSLPPIPPAPNANDSLNDKPKCQSSYRDIYQIAFQPTTDDEDFRKLYFTLQKKVDREIMKVLTALFESSFANNTMIIFTSDHGDYLGSHGLFQKWYSAYEEAIKVPLSFYIPGVKPCSYDLLTSHVDIVPTILGFLGIKEEILADEFIHYRPLVGRDLSPLFKGEMLPEVPQFFMTDDNVTKGLHHTTYNITFPTVEQPSSVETLIIKVNGVIYKYSRYINNPQFAGTPLNVRPTAAEIEDALNTPKEYELYNLLEDPYELNNLSTTLTPEQNRFFELILLSEIKKKRLYPLGHILQEHKPNFPPPG